MITRFDLSEDAWDAIIIEFLQMDEEIGDTQEIREACRTLLSYCGVKKDA